MAEKELSRGHGVVLGLLQARGGSSSFRLLSFSPEAELHPHACLCPCDTTQQAQDPAYPDPPHSLTGRGSQPPPARPRGFPEANKPSPPPPTPGRAHLSSSSRWAFSASPPSTSLQRSVELALEARRALWAVAVILAAVSMWLRENTQQPWPRAHKEAGWAPTHSADGLGLLPSQSPAPSLPGT